MEVISYIAYALSLLFIFLLGAVFGWSRHEEYVNNRMNNIIKHMHAEIKKDVIEITIENHNGMIYIYNKDTKSFMAQGSTRQEVEKILLDKFPGKKFAADPREIEEGLRDAKSI